MRYHSSPSWIDDCLYSLWSEKCKQKQTISKVIINNQFWSKCCLHYVFWFLLYAIIGALFTEISLSMCHCCVTTFPAWFELTNIVTLTEFLKGSGISNHILPLRHHIILAIWHQDWNNLQGHPHVSGPWQSLILGGEWWKMGYSAQKWPLLGFAWY